MAAISPAQVFTLLPPNARNLIQAGSGDGALARHYKQIYPASFYQAVEAGPEAAQRARAHCDSVHQADLEQAGDDFFRHFAMADGWIFDRTLGLLRQPLAVLKAIARHLAADACVVICAPNSTYWQAAAVAPGALSRAQLLDCLQHAGFNMTTGVALNGQPPDAAAQAALRLEAGLGSGAADADADAGAGAGAEQLIRDAHASHFLIKAMLA